MKKKSGLIVLIVLIASVFVVVSTFSEVQTAKTADKTGAAKTNPAKSSPGKSKSSTKKPQDEIHVSADELVSDRNANYAEFRGNVVTTQKGAVMHSDRLKIIYSQTTEKKGASKDEKQNGAIEKVIATGHVKIVMEDKTAWADVATYTKADDSILLTGQNPKILSGKSYLSGETIRLNRSTQEVFVNTGPGVGSGDGKKPKKRVEANFFPGEPGLTK